MLPHRIRSMAATAVSLDTETHRFQAGLAVPPLVCGSIGYYDAEAHQQAMAESGIAGYARVDAPKPSPVRGEIMSKDETVEVFARALAEPDRVVAGANIAFDLMVFANESAKRGRDAFPAIFRALEEGRVYDLLIAEGLHAVACGHLGKDPRTNAKIVNPETKKPGSYSLASVVDMVLGRRDAKINDEWKLRYNELDLVPMSEWPRTAVDYPIDDARNTIEVALAQAGHLPKISVHHNWGPDGCLDCGARKLNVHCLTRRPHRNLHDLANQVYTAFAMSGGAGWGFRVNQRSVDIIARHALQSRADGIAPFKTAGIIRDDGSESQSAVKRMVAMAYGSTRVCPVCRGTGKMPSPANPRSMIACFEIVDNKKIRTCDGTGLQIDDSVPRTETDGVSIGGDTLAESGDDFLMSFDRYKNDQKILSTYVPYLRRGRTPIKGHLDGCTREQKKNVCTCPGPYKDIPLTLSPNVLLETGRTSYRGVIQLFPRAPGHIDRKTEEYVPSLRECIEARPKHLLGSVDYDSGELVTHSQSCIWIVGESKLANALLNKVKPHNALGATMIGMMYDEFQRRIKEPVCKDARQAAKPPNFGYPGGMGAAKLVLQQRAQGPDTPHPTGPNLIQDENGNLVRGYKGLRFCILMDKAEACGIQKVREWKDRKIPPTCLHCIQCAVRLKEVWLRQWPENKQYFNFVSHCVENGQEITADMLRRWPHLQEVYAPGQRLAPGEIMQHYSGRVRGGVSFTSGANGFFQGLLGDLAKSAVRRISRECYDRTVRVPAFAHDNSRRSKYAGGESPLYGSRLIVFQHDEIIPEMREDVAHDAISRLSEVMIDEMRWYCPDLADAAKAPPALMQRWMKGAEPWYKRGGQEPADANDTLVAWEPAKKAA